MWFFTQFKIHARESKECWKAMKNSDDDKMTSRNA